MRMLTLHASGLAAPLIAVVVSLSVVGCSSCGGTSSPNREAEPASVEGSADEGSGAGVATVSPAETDADGSDLLSVARRALAVGRTIDPPPELIRVQIMSQRESNLETDVSQLARECEMLVPDTCQLAGALSMDGTADGVRALIDHWSRGCAGGDDHLCRALASFLVSVDAGDRVAEALGPACEEGVTSACESMAWARLDELEDQERARLGRACADGSGRACRLTAASHVARDELAPAAAAFEHGCGLGDLPSCTGQVAAAIALGQEPGPEMLEQLATQCRVPSAPACALLGHAAFEPGMDTLALYRDVITPWRAACTAGDARSCRDIAWALLDTVPQPSVELLAAEGSGDAPPSPEVAAWQAIVDEATPWLVTSCNLGIGEACMRMVGILETRELSEQEQLLRAELRRRACEAGVTDACSPAGQPHVAPDPQ